MEDVVATVPVAAATDAVGFRVTTWLEPGFVAVTVTFAAREEAVAWLYAAFVKPHAEETEERSLNRGVSMLIS